MSEGLGVAGYRQALMKFVTELLLAANRSDDPEAVTRELLGQPGAFTTYFDSSDLLRVEAVKLAMAPILTAPVEKPLPGPANFYGAGSQTEFDALPPLERARRVDLANYARSEAEKRVEDQKRDAIATADLPPGYEGWSPENKLQHYYRMQEKAKAAKGAA